jgi:hypothetical protein
MAQVFAEEIFKGRGLRRSIFFLWAVGMTNVGGLIAPEGILSDVRSMIPNPL